MVEQEESQVGESIREANNRLILTSYREGGYPEKEVTTPQNAAGQDNVDAVRISVCTISPAPCRLLLLLVNAHVDGFQDNGLGLC